jgi:hypothetical protein
VTDLFAGGENSWLAKKYNPGSRNFINTGYNWSFIVTIKFNLETY